MSLAWIWLIGLVRGSFREAGTQEEVKMTSAVAAGFGITICMAAAALTRLSSGARPPVVVLSIAHRRRRENREGRNDIQ